VVGVVCALRSEARHLGRTTSTRSAIDHLPDGTLLAVTGMGPAAAAAGAAQLATAGAGALLCFGMAGALDPQLHSGRLVLPLEVADPAGAVFTCDPGWRARVAAVVAALEPVTSGRIASVAAPLTTAAAKAALWRSGALAVDMESAAVARVARERGLPFIAVRVIIDDAATELPGAVTAATGADGQVSSWGVIAHLVRKPAQMAPLIRLARGYSAANRTLGAVVRAGGLARAHVAGAA
jgi:adenosylhomocysteine nucleosidase